MHFERKVPGVMPVLHKIVFRSNKIYAKNTENYTKGDFEARELGWFLIEKHKL